METSVIKVNTIRKIIPTIPSNIIYHSVKFYYNFYVKKGRCRFFSIDNCQYWGRSYSENAQKCLKERAFGEGGGVFNKCSFNIFCNLPISSFDKLDSTNSAIHKMSSESHALRIFLIFLFVYFPLKKKPANAEALTGYIGNSNYLRNKYKPVICSKN
jgi:hypothetical protein